MKALRKPQLDLRLDAAPPDAAPRWHNGAMIFYRGRPLRLRLDGLHGDTTLHDDELHLPLPPGATPRQIQDRCEIWLREQAGHHLRQIIEKNSALAGRRAPHLALSFARSGHWIEAIGEDVLRCHWRLIEEPDAVIDQVIARALAALPAAPAMADLFATDS